MRKAINILLGLILLAGLAVSMVGCGNSTSSSDGETIKTDAIESAGLSEPTSEISAVSISDGLDYSADIEHDTEAEANKLLTEIGDEHPLKSVTAHGTNTDFAHGPNLDITNYYYTEYYPNGELLMEESINGAEKNAYFLDSNGKIALEIRDDKDGNEIQYRYYYDDKGNLTLKYDEATGYAKVIKYEYDDKGNIAQKYESGDCKYVYANGGPFSIDEIMSRYDDIFSKNDSIGTYYEYTYDDNNNVSSEIMKQYKSDGNYYQYGEINYEYNPDGSPTASLSNYSGPNCTESATYDMNGNMLKFEVTNDSKSCNGYYNLQYDGHGNLTSSDLICDEDATRLIAQFYRSFNNRHAPSMGTVEESCTYENEYY